MGVVMMPEMNGESEINSRQLSHSMRYLDGRLE